MNDYGDGYAPADPRVPAPLIVAVSVLALEAFALVAVGVTLMFDIDSERVIMGLTSAAFLCLYGAAIAGFSWRLYATASPSARSPLVMTQILQGLIAVSAFGTNVVISVAVLVCSAIALAGIFHPDSLRVVAASDN